MLAAVRECSRICKGAGRLRSHPMRRPRTSPESATRVGFRNEGAENVGSESQSVNTPAHAIINLSLLGRGNAEPGRRFDGWILAGSVLPDVPMFGFYLWQRLVAGESESRIWGELYFESGWQTFFDWFNSIPLAGLACLVAWRLGNHAAAWLFASVALHCAIDLPLHHDDAHRHFLPISDWRFESPVSYWDPAHRGSIGALLEAIAVVIGSAVMFRRTSRNRWRVFWVGVALVYSAGYAVVYLSGAVRLG